MALVVALLGGGPADETPGMERLDRRPGEADPLLTGRATELMTRLGSRRSGGNGYPAFNGAVVTLRYPRVLGQPSRRSSTRESTP